MNIYSVLQVHNYYKQRGGEANVLDQEYNLLTDKGNEVFQYTVDNRNINTTLKAVKVAINSIYSIGSKKSFNQFLKNKLLDVIHVHNFFPLLTPSVFDSAVENNIPSILTLHNYRLLHPNGLMLHDGNIDERSINGSAYACVLDGVYRDSIVQTAIVASMIEYHRKIKTWHRKVDGFIALTDFSKAKFVEGGLPEDKIFVKPNFVVDPVKKCSELIIKSKKKDYLFVGRISEEKGIKDLIDAWIKLKPTSNLTIIGDGPLRQFLEKKTNTIKNIKWLGNKPNLEVYKWLNKSKAMIFPSTWYEGFPMTILEAFSVGCPVICSNIGSQKSIIKNGITGLHFKVGDLVDLINKVNLLESNEGLVDELGKNARQEYLNNYTPDKNYNMLIDIYEDVISKK